MAAVSREGYAPDKILNRGGEGAIATTTLVTPAAASYLLAYYEDPKG